MNREVEEILEHKGESSEVGKSPRSICRGLLTADVLRDGARPAFGKSPDTLDETPKWAKED